MVKLFYYSKEENFGDAVNPFILERIFSRSCVAAAPDEAELFMIGSILQKAAVPQSKIFRRLGLALKKPLSIWSSGFICEPSKKVCVPRKLNVCALRGRLSKNILESLTGQKFDVPLGDGGLLISHLLPELPEKKYQVGIIPHYADENLPEIKQLLAKIPGSVVISPLGNPLECAMKIAECSTVLSSSLHGLIASDSFGIPNRQLILSSNIKGGLFKYNDYFSIFGLTAEPLTAADILNHGLTADDIHRNYRITPSQTADISEKLLASFPFR